MNTYHKIQSVWNRDPATKFATFLEGQWALPEFEYLADLQWRWTEKVDGTNIRVIVFEDIVQFRGKSDAAQIPPFLLEKLAELFPFPRFSRIFDVAPLSPICLYGEGYGARIQKGGGNYIPDGVDFILFDVKIGDNWLKDEDMRGIAARLGIKAVPVKGEGTLYQAIETTRFGILSDLSYPGNFLHAEGLVCKPLVELRDRVGNRIITKMKHKDFAR